MINSRQGYTHRVRACTPAQCSTAHLRSGGTRPGGCDRWPRCGTRGRWRSTWRAGSPPAPACTACGWTPPSCACAAGSSPPPTPSSGTRTFAVSTMLSGDNLSTTQWDLHLSSQPTRWSSEGVDYKNLMEITPKLITCIFLHCAACHAWGADEGGLRPGQED